MQLAEPVHQHSGEIDAILPIHRVTYDCAQSPGTLLEKRTCLCRGKVPRRESQVDATNTRQVGEGKRRQLILDRNPNYTGDRVANFDKIVYSVGVDLQQGLLQIRNGQADYAADGVPPASNGELGDQYGADSDAASNGLQQYFVNPALTVNYLALNTSRPLANALLPCSSR